MTYEIVYVVRGSRPMGGVRGPQKVQVGQVTSDTNLTIPDGAIVVHVRPLDDEDA